MPDFADFLPVAGNNSNIDIAGSIHTAPDPVLDLPKPTQDPNATSGFDNYLGTPSLEDKMRPTPFDWEKSQADRYVQNRHFATEGFDPYAIPETINGQSYNANELKYAKVQTWSDVMSNAVGGSLSLAKNTFIEGWKGWSNVGNAFGTIGSDRSFMEALAGSAEDLLEKNTQQQAIFNKYAVFKSPIDNTGFGVFNREFLGDMIQQSGFSIGAGAQFLSEMLVTAGIGEGLGAVAKGAGWLAKGVAGTEALAEGIDMTEKSLQMASKGTQINAMRMASDPTSLKSFAGNLWDFTKKAAGKMGDIYDVAGGIDKLAKAREAGASTYQLLSMGIGGITRFAAAVNSAATEARFEAANTYGQMYGDLLQEYQDAHDGAMPAGKELDRIKNLSYSAGVDNFGANTVLISAMNQLEWGNMMSKFGSTSRVMRELAEGGDKELFTITGKLNRDIAAVGEGSGLKAGQIATQPYLKGRFGTLSTFNPIRRDFGLGTALWQVAKRSPATKIEFLEGLQEVLQNTSDQTFRDYYTNLYHGGKDINGHNLVKDIFAADWAKGLQSQMNMQGWQTFLMGAATGLFLTPIQSTVMGGFRKGQEKFNSQYKADRAGYKQMLNDNLTILQTWYNDPKKALAEHINNTKVQGQVDKTLGEAVQDGDKYTYHNAVNDAFTKAVATSIKSGTYESFVNTIQEFGDRMTDEQFQEAFGLKPTTENKVRAKDFTTGIVKDIERYHDNWENLKDQYSYLIQPQLVAHDKEAYKKAKVAKAALDDYIEMLATTSHHATTTITRATDIRAKVAAIPGIDTSANKGFEVLADAKSTAGEINRLQQELTNLQGLPKDSVVSTQVANTREQLKHLKSWQGAYDTLEGIRNGLIAVAPNNYPSFSQQKVEEQLKKAHLGYLTAVNSEYGKVTPTLNHQQTNDIFQGLMDYNTLYRDHGQYIDALNLITDPKNIYRMMEKITDGRDHAGATLHQDHADEVANRTEAVAGEHIDNEPVEQEPEVATSEQQPTTEEFITEQPTVQKDTTKDDISKKLQSIGLAIGASDTTIADTIANKLGWSKKYVQNNPGSSILPGEELLYGSTNYHDKQGDNRGSNTNIANNFLKGYYDKEYGGQLYNKSTEESTQNSEQQTSEPEVITPAIPLSTLTDVKGKVAEYYNNGKKKGNTKVVKEFLAAHPDIKRALDIIHKRVGLTDEQKVEEYDKVLKGVEDVTPITTDTAPDQEPTVTPTPTVVTNRSELPSLVPTIDFDSAWADDELWKRLVPEDAGLSVEDRQKKYTKDGEQYPKLPNAIFREYTWRAKFERTIPLTAIPKDNLYDNLLLKVKKHTGAKGFIYDIELVTTGGDSIGWLYNSPKDRENPTVATILSLLATKLGNRDSMELTGTELEQVLHVSVGRGSLALVTKDRVRPQLALNELNYNTVDGKLVVRDNGDFATKDFISGSEEDISQEITDDQSRFKGMYSAAIQFPDGHSYWVQLSPRTLADEEVQGTINAINEQAGIAVKGDDNDIKEVNRNLSGIFPALDVFRNDTTNTKGLRIYLRLDPGNPEKGIAGGNKLGVTVVYKPVPFEKGVTVFGAIKQEGGGAIHFTDVDDLLSRLNTAIDDINNQHSGLPQVPHIERKNLKEQVPFGASKEVIMRMLTNVVSPNVVNNVGIGLNIATIAPVINEQSTEVPLKVTTHNSVTGNGLVNEPPPMGTIPTRFEDMPGHPTPDLSTTEARKAYQKQLRANAKEKGASKIVRSSDIFSGQSIENIDKFSAWVTTNLPSVISVTDLGNLVKALQDNKVQIGQFVGYLDELQQVRGTINVHSDTAYKYHEAFHGVFRLLLTQQQQDNLYAEARKLFPVTDEALEELRTLELANEHLSREQLEKLYLEEQMADKFDSWKMNQSTPLPFGIKSFFTKVWDFIKGLFTKMDKSLMMTMFRDIDSGQYKNSTIQSNEFTEQLTNDPFTFTIPVSKVIKVGTKEVDLPNGTSVTIDRHLPQQEADRLVSTLTALFDQEVRNSKLPTYDTGAILDRLLNRYKDTYDMDKVDYDSRIDAIESNDAKAQYMQRIEDMYTIFSTKGTRDSIKEAVVQSLRVIGYKATLEQDAMDTLTNEYGPKNADNFDRNDGTMAGPEGKAQELRKFIAGTTTPAVDEFGNTHFYPDESGLSLPMIEAVNAGNVYNGMLKLLANESDMDRQLQKILQFRKINSDKDGNILTNKATVATINRFLEYTGYNSTSKEFTANQQMVNLFLKGFSSYAANYLFIQATPNGEYVVSNANNKDAGKVQTDTWAQSFAMGYGKKLFAQDSDKGYKELYNTNSKPFTLFSNALNLSGKEEAISDTKLQGLSQQISNLLKANFGINLHPKYIEYSILSGKNPDVLDADQKEYISSFSDITPIKPEGLESRLVATLIAGNNPFEKAVDNSKVDNSVMNYLTDIARSNAIFDETIGTMSFTNANGDIRYAHTFPNFYHITVGELNNPEHIQELRDAPDTENNFLLGSKEFKELVDQKKLRVDITEGLRVTGDNEGVTYDGFNIRETLAYLLGMYDIGKQRDAKVVTGTGADDFFYRTRHLIRVVEAKKTGYMIGLPVISSAVTNNTGTHLSKKALDIFYGMVTDEVARINRVQQEITTGRDADGNEVTPIKGYHTGSREKIDELRGLKLYNTKLMLGDLAQEIEDDPTKELNEKAIRKQLDSYWRGEVNNLVQLMQQEGLISDKEENLLAPAYLWKGFTDTDNVPSNERNRAMGIIEGNFRHNLTQVMVNDFLNTTAINNLLHRDEAKSFKFFTDQVKRAAGAAATGPSIESGTSRDDWGITHQLHDIHHVTFGDTEFTKRDGTTGQQDDGQMYATQKGFRYMLFGLGTLNQLQVDLLDKISMGEKVSPKEFYKAGGIQDMKSALNPMKMVYFDGKVYLKCSVTMLAKELTSYKVGNTWYAHPGMEEQHLLREKMQAFENGRETIAFASPESVSKGFKSNIVGTIGAITDNHFTKLAAGNMRQQVENPSGKVTITDPTQKLQQIFAEIPTDSKVYYDGKWYQGKGTEELHPIVDKYLNLVAQRFRNSYTQKRNSIFDITGVFNEISTSFAQRQVTPKLTEFYNSAYDNLLATGADAQTLEFFRTKDGDIQYDLNFPATLQKYTQLFLSYFSNGVMSAKTPGLSLTVISNAHHKMVKRLISVDKLGQPKEWEVIPWAEFDKEPHKYTESLIRYSNDGNRTFSGLKEQLKTGEPVYYLDDLRDNVGIYDGRGKRIGTYTEYLTTQHYKEDDSATIDGQATRIPADDKHSYANVRRVDTLPVWMGSSGMFPQEMMVKNGMDFDLDKLYVTIPDTYRVGNQRIAYGTASDTNKQYDEYVTWQLDNNKALKDSIKEKLSSDPDVKLLQDRVSKLRGIKEDLKQQWIDNEDFIANPEGYLHLFTKARRELKIAQKEIVDEYKDLTETLQEIKMAYVMQSLREQKLPDTVSAFVKAGGTNINNGVVNNQLLDTTRALMSSEALTTGDNPIINQPTSTQAFDDLTITIPQLLEGATSECATNLINRLQEVRKDTNSLIGKVLAFDVNNQGRENIGAAANAVINYSVNNTFNIPIEGPKLNLDGKEYDSYAPNRAWNGESYDGQRVFAAISAMENAMTDNAKYSYSGKFGLSISAVGYVSNMLAQGVPFETAMLFILQPTVQEYLKRVGNLQGSLKTDVERFTSKSSVMKSFRDELDSAVQEQLEDPDKLVEHELQGYPTINREQLIDNIKRGEHSLNVLDLLAIIDKQSTDLMDMSRILKLTQGLPTTWEDFDDIKAAMNKFGLIDPTTKEKGVTIDVDGILNGSHKFMAEYIKAFRELDALSSHVFLERTSEFGKLHSAVINNFDVSNRDKVKFNKKLKDNLLSYMSIKAYIHSLNQTKLGDYTASLNHAMIYDEAKRMYTGYRDAIDIVTELNEQEDTNYLAKYFLNTIYHDQSKERINRLEANSWAKLSEYQQQRLIDSYVSLYSNPDTHLDAVALFHYLLVKDGGQFKNGSFIRYIPNEIFKNLLDQTAEVNKVLSQDNVDNEQYTKVFGTTSEQLLDEFLKSYATHISNLPFIKIISTSTAVSAVQKVEDTIVVDKFKNLDKGSSKEEMIENYDVINSAGFATTDVGEGDNKVTKVIFPYSIKAATGLYVLSSVDGKGISEPSDFITAGEYSAKSDKGIYTKAPPRGSIGQWEGAGVFGEIPVLDSNAPREGRSTNVLPYAESVPTGKETKVTEKRGYTAGDIKFPSTITAIEQLNNQYGLQVAMTKDGWVAGKVNDIMIAITSPEKLLEFMRGEQGNPDEQRLAQLEENKALQMETNPDILIAQHIPRITPESARAEVGANIGAGSDINPQMLSKNGVTVQQAAHSIMEDYFHERSGFSQDEQYIRNVIIEILQTGKKNFIDGITRQSEIDNLKNTIRTQQDIVPSQPTDEQVDKGLSDCKLTGL